tara:strand:- start:306 stop:836 length:531 start_codon:yes stop_codon:yes gene_type:complete
MTKEFVELAKSRFPFTILRHPNKFSYYDEMLEGFECSFFGFDQGIELTRILFEDGYNFRQYRSPLGTIIYRTINDETIRFGDSWWRYFEAGVNRDQISFDAALQLNDLNPKIIEDRNDCGVALGYYNKVGRKGKHPQRGALDQWQYRHEFINAMKSYVGMSKIYIKHKHDFMRSVQ